MLGLDRRAARFTWTAALILLLLEGLYRIRETLLIFTVALLLAYLLWPLVDFLNRRLPGRSRVPALTIVYLAMIALLILIGVEIGSRVVAEANALISRVPELVTKLKQPAAATVSPSEHPVRSAALEALRKQLAEHSRDLVSLLPEAGFRLVFAARYLVFIALVPILSFFFLKDGTEIRQSLLDLVAASPRRDAIEEIAADLHVLLAQYMRALLLLAATAFVAYTVFLSSIGAPYAVLLGAVAFPLELFPLVGPLSAGAIILMVTAMSGFHHLLWILAFILLFRIFQDYVISPHVMSAGMQLHPLAVIFGVVAGAHLGGVAGTFLSVPALATLRIIYRRLIRRPQVEHVASGGGP